MAGHSHLQALKKTTSKGLEFSSNKKIKMQENLQDSKKTQKDSRTTRTQEHKELKNTKSSRTSRTQEHQKLKNNKFSRTTKDSKTTRVQEQQFLKNNKFSRTKRKMHSNRAAGAVLTTAGAVRAEDSKKTQINSKKRQDKPKMASWLTRRWRLDVEWL